MKVFKFGGASLKDAEAIKHVASIIASSKNNLVVVVSALGKTTDALEKIFTLAAAKKNYTADLQALKDTHHAILKTLFSDQRHPVYGRIDSTFDALEVELKKSTGSDEGYDQVISFGEVLSSLIVSEYMNATGLTTQWIDARQYIVTNNTFREGKVDWITTAEKIRALREHATNAVLLTQGFIGKTPQGLTTTLGREGSDFSAAIFASCLQASDVTIWKDVPGVMSADPKRLPGAMVFDELPFKEAAEMTYYGATVIHPKTIKPLANKGIPLFVKSFLDPTLPGTKIHECVVENLPPLVIFKGNQCLVSCKVVDYTFINEQQLGIIFTALSEVDVRINMMQNSAISFSFCIDFRESKITALIEKLHHHFEVYYNAGLTLITVKNFDKKTFDTYSKKPNVLLEQSSRSTLQVLIRT